jgi:hypothetical protein
MNMKLATVLLCLGGLVAGCGRDAGPPPGPAAAAPSVETLATTRQVMLGLTIPASDVLFKVSDETVKTDADWERVVANAMMLAESGQMLLTGTRDLQQPEWRQQAAALVAASRTAADAALQKNMDAVLDAGNTIYESCDACHAKYMPARQGEKPPQ